MSKVQNKIGKRIKQLRELKGLTQEKVEEVSGINPSYLSALERGQKNVTLEMLERVAVVLDVELFQLFFFESDSDLPSKAELTKVIAGLDRKKTRQLLELLKIIQ